jgi:predicted phosphoribosyltransferase
MPDVPFQDRYDAGRKLAEKLTQYAKYSNLLVLALTGGGLAVASEVAKALKASLDIFLVRNLPAPGLESLSMGAVVSGGVTVYNQDVTRRYDIPNNQIDAVAQRERKALEELEHSYHPDRPLHDPENRTVILVDDGLATSSMVADAATGIRELGAIQVILAIPTATPDTYTAYDDFDETDVIICAETPHDYRSVDMFYADNSPVSDEQIRKLLADAPKQ